MFFVGQCVLLLNVYLDTIIAILQWIGVQDPSCVNQTALLPQQLMMSIEKFLEPVCQPHPLQIFCAQYRRYSSSREAMCSFSRRSLLWGNYEEYFAHGTAEGIFRTIQWCTQWFLKKKIENWIPTRRPSSLSSAMAANACWWVLMLGELVTFAS